MAISLTGLASDLSILDDDSGITAADRSDLARYINEARCFIASLNPAYYAVVKTIAITQGSVHKVCECDIITEAIGQVDGPCDTTIRDNSFPQDWGGLCATKKDDDGVTLTSITVNKQHVTVKPAVPEGETVYLMVRCTPSDLMQASDEDDLGSCKDAAALSAYAMYRVALRDSDGDSNMIALANVHLRTFADLSGLQYQITKQAIEDTVSYDDDPDE